MDSKRPEDARGRVAGRARKPKLKALIASIAAVAMGSACSGTLDYTPADDDAGVLVADAALNDAGDAPVVVRSPSAPQVFASHPGRDDHPSLLRAKDGTFYLAFDSNRDGIDRVWLSASTDGLAWSEPRALTPSDELATAPSLVQTTDGQFHMVWTRTKFVDGGVTSAIMYARSSDTVAWLAPFALSRSDARATSPTIVERVPGTIVVVWSSDLPYLTTPRDLYVRMSTTGGASWEFPTYLYDGGATQFYTGFYDDDAPFLAAKPDGALVLVSRNTPYWNSPSPYEATTALVVSFAPPGGSTWTERAPVLIPGGDNGVHDITGALYPSGDPSGWSVVFSFLNEADGYLRTVNLSKRPALLPDFRPLTSDTTNGRSARMVPTETPGVYLLAWVGNISEDAGSSTEIFTRFVAP